MLWIVSHVSTTDKNLPLVVTTIHFTVGGKCLTMSPLMGSRSELISLILTKDRWPYGPCNSKNSTFINITIDAAKSSALSFI